MKFMRVIILLFTIVSISSSVFGLSDGINDKNHKYMERNSIKLTIKNGETFTATLTDNSSAKGLMELLSKGDITIEMEDYGNMEKVGPLGTNLPRNDRQTTTGPGDIILYQGKYLVIPVGGIKLAHI